LQTIARTFLSFSEKIEKKSEYEKGENPGEDNFLARASAG
jgi:hypothetical protein